MSERDEAMRAMAANRGCKLTKSRRRKPGGDYGRYGLKEAGSGAQLFGFGKDGLTATADEIEAFLRGGAASSWKTSLRATPAGKPRAAARKEAAGQGRPAEGPKNRAEPERPQRRAAAEPPRKRPEPEPPKAAVVRDAAPRDADRIAGLINALGYEVTAADVRRRLTQLRRANEAPLVAEADGVIGCVTWHVTPVIHRPRPVGRLTMLVVAEKQRGKGIGQALVEAAEARLRERGCGLIEVTSNMRRLRAHGFYERLGYERTSYRFAKAAAVDRSRPAQEEG